MGLFDFFKKKRRATLVNGVLSVTLKNGNTLVFTDANKNIFDIVMDQDFPDEDILQLYYREMEKERKTIQSIIDTKEKEKAAEVRKMEAAKSEIRAAEELENNFPTLVKSGDFEAEDGVVYMKGIKLSIPTELVREFVNALATDNSEYYSALKNFWMWCSLCPNPQSREDLFNWIKVNGLRINKNGFFFAYRKVVSVRGDDEYDEDYSEERTTMSKKLSEFISNSYMKIKAQKKGPKNFWVERDPDDGDEFVLSKEDRTSFLEPGDVIGNLWELHNDLTTSEVLHVRNTTIPVQTYTDAHTRKMVIKMGQEVSLPANKCDWDNLQACSNGLHIRGNRDHGCGDTPIVVLVNPMNVVAVPVYDNTKMRVRAYFPVAVISPDEDMKILDEISTLDMADDYLSEQVDSLNELVQRNTPTELLQHRVMADLSPEAIKLIASRVTNIKATLQRRVISA